MKKSVRGLLLALAAAAALTLSVLAAESGFARINTYAPGQFADVPEDIWCADNVKSAYEFGIMDGREEGRDWIDITLTPAMEETAQCLLDLGLVTPEDLVTKRELYPDRYADEDVDVIDGVPYYHTASGDAAVLVNPA